MPIINQYTQQGTLFCSDGWKAYFKLAEHLDIEDVLHFPVNHSKNYVDPDTGAHTQTIESLWGSCQRFLAGSWDEAKRSWIVPWLVYVVAL